MLSFKKEIAKQIAKELNLKYEELVESIEIPKDTKQGDYAFPCFRLAKTLKKAPQAIAEELKEKVKFDKELIEKAEVINGYLNLFINKEKLIKITVEEMSKKQKDYRKIGHRKRQKHNSRILITKHSKTISHRTPKNNSNRKRLI